MGAPKGHARYGGRAKGQPNKVTVKAREAVALFVDGNVHRLEAWLDEIAKDSPKDAFNCFMSVVDYHIPRLARTEATVNVDANMNISVTEDAAKRMEERKERYFAKIAKIEGNL